MLTGISSTYYFLPKALQYLLYSTKSFPLLEKILMNEISENPLHFPSFQRFPSIFLLTTDMLLPSFVFIVHTFQVFGKQDNPSFKILPSFSYIPFLLFIFHFLAIYFLSPYIYILLLFLNFHLQLLSFFPPILYFPLPFSSSLSPFQTALKISLLLQIAFAVYITICSIFWSAYDSFSFLVEIQYFRR